MPHSAELIRTILTLVKRDYPPDNYRYVIERFLPGTRMAPDIAVFSLTGQALYVVEIGYTRPEKLTAYRHAHKIADVRWYDKSGVLHGDVQEKVTRMTVTFNADMEVSVYNPFHIMPCRADDCFNEPEGDCDNYFNALEEAEDEAQSDVESVIITDGVRAWIFNFCDKCGEIWLSSDEEDGDVDWILEELRDGHGHSHAEAWGKRERMSWAKIGEMLKASFDFDLIYDDGFWLHKKDRGQFNRHIMKLRAG